jgi:hypothetical protein
MAMTCGSSADQLRRIALGMLVSSMLSGVGAASAQAPDAMASVRRQALSTVMAADFVDPPMRARPMYRFWNSGGLMTKESIETQVAQIKRAGAGGFEANQLVGIPRLSRAEHFDPAVHGFGSPAWTRAWTQLFEAGKAAGLEVDQIYTPGWSAGIQGISPDGEGAAQEIGFGSINLAPGQTYNGAAPVGGLPNGVTRRTLQAVVAYRCRDNCADSAKAAPVLDPASARDLTKSVRDGRIRFVAPSGSDRYVLVASWMHGTGQVVELAHTAQPSYLVDHFGAAGADAIISYWERRVLTPQLRNAMRASGGAVFFDSLELNRMDVEVRHWTPNFLDEFRRRRGYDLRPFLATISTSDKPAFELAGTVGARVREDYRQTLSDLFVANHIGPIKRWAHGYGMALRGQAYSEWGPGAINNSDAAIALDIPEQEANNRGAPLFAVDHSDSWRQLASANAQVGRTIVSSEMGTFGRTDGLARVSLVARVNEMAGLGMNKVVHHGWADQSPGVAKAWPGYYPFGSFVGDNYGPQSPTFADDALINTYIARLQTVLRRGGLHADVAIYWGGTGAARYDSLDLERAGFSYGFMSDRLIADPSATLAQGRLTRLGYRAFVLDGMNGGVPMSIASARRVLSWARAGLPIVAIGDLPSRVGGYHPRQDAELRQVLAELARSKSFVQVANHTGVREALVKAGVTPDVSYDTAPLVAMHRKAAEADYYYLFNAGAGRTRSEVTLRGRGDLYRYDAWSGKVAPVIDYARTADGVRVKVDLATGDSALFALSEGAVDGARPICRAPEIRSDAQDVIASGSDLHIRDTRTGRHAVEAANGKISTGEIAAVGGVVRPKEWRLDVTSWRAGASPRDTAKVKLATISVSADGEGRLADWQKIAGLQTVSGVATYATDIDVGAGWTGGTGAYLDLGSFFGVVQLSVNGRDLPPLNQVDVSRIDLGGYLKPGRNTLQVRLSTPVYNASFKTKSPYGLIGPVVLTPYGEAIVPGACAQ